MGQPDVDLLPKVHFDMVDFKGINFHHAIEPTANYDKLISLIAHEE